MDYNLPVTGSGPTRAVSVAEHEAAVDEAIGRGVGVAVARANHTGTQPISTVAGLQAALDAKPSLDEVSGVALGGRPGQQMRAFVSAAAGAPAGLTPIADVAGVTSANIAGLGQVARVDSTPAIIATREAQAVQRGRVYRVHAYVRRLADGADPAGNTVALQLARLDAAYAQLGVITVDARILRVTDGLWHLTATVALDPGALAGVDWTLAEGTVYVRPYVQVFTSDHQTAVAQIDVVDVTEAASIDGALDVVALAGAVELAGAEAAAAAGDRVQVGLDRALSEAARDQTIAAAARTYDSVDDMLADETDWPESTVLSVRGTGEYEVSDTPSYLAAPAISKWLSVKPGQVGALNCLAFGDPGDGESNYSSVLATAFGAAQDLQVPQLILPARRIGIGSMIAWPQEVTLKLVGQGYKLLPIAGPISQTRAGTWLRRISDEPIFDLTGTSLLDGGPLTHRPHMEGILFDGAGLTVPLLTANSCAELTADDCGFTSVDGVGLDFLELFDSRMNRCRFAQMGTADGDACIALRSGFDGRETTNQLHFTSGIWENFPGPAISARKNDPDAIDVNEIYFTTCKMETAVGEHPLLDFEDVSGVHFNLLQLALRGDPADTVSSLAKFNDCTNITGVLHVELYGPTGATVTNHVELRGTTRSVDLTVIDYGERDVSSGYSMASDVVTPSIQYTYVNRGKPTIGSVWTPFLNVDGRGRLDGKAASPRLALTRTDIAGETWDVGNVTADGAGSKWELLHNGTAVFRANNDNTLTNLFAMVLGASINGNGNRLSNVSAMSRFAWTTLTSAASGVLACGNTDMIIADISGGAIIVDITSTLSGIPIITIRNVNASAITITHNNAKLRCMGGTDKVLNQHEAIVFAFVGGAIWQQIGGKN